MWKITSYKLLFKNLNHFQTVFKDLKTSIQPCLGVPQQVEGERYLSFLKRRPLSSNMDGEICPVVDNNDVLDNDDDDAADDEKNMKVRKITRARQRRHIAVAAVGLVVVARCELYVESGQANCYYYSYQVKEEEKVSLSTH